MVDNIHIGIAGAGAVGCHYGSKLAQSGYDVKLLARGEHLLQLQLNGLLHESDGEARRIMLTASDNPAELSACNVILLACKMTSLADLLEQLADHIRTDALIVTMQNGVEPPEIVATHFPEHAVAAGTAFIGARIEAPGHLIHSAAGGLRVGEWQQGSGSPLLHSLADAFNASGVATGIDADPAAMLWRKLLWNTGFNAITAITRRYAREVAAVADSRSTILDAMLETVSVAQAMGIQISPDDAEAQIEATLAMGPVKTSMWQDIEMGRTTEIDTINGAVVRLGAQHGIATPVNRTLCALVRAIESKRTA